jgi:signal transduction histidine kinase
VTVTDDGVPAATAEEATPGYGLVGMRERAEVLGGTLEVGREGATGFLVRAVLPLGGNP